MPSSFWATAAVCAHLSWRWPHPPAFLSSDLLVGCPPLEHVFWRQVCLIQFSIPSTSHSVRWEFCENHDCCFYCGYYDYCWWYYSYRCCSCGQCSWWASGTLPGTPPERSAHISHFLILFWRGAWQEMRRRHSGRRERFESYDRKSTLILQMVIRLLQICYSSWIFKKNICTHGTLSVEYLAFPLKSDCSDHGDAIGRDVDLSTSNTHFINNYTNTY